MKTFPLFAVCLSIALVQTASAQDKDDVKPPKNRAKTAPSAQQVAPKVAPNPRRTTSPNAAGSKVNRWQQQPQVNRPINPANAQVNPRIRPNADIPREGRWQQPPVVSQPNVQADARLRANPDMPRTLNKVPRDGGAIQPEVGGGNRNWRNTGGGNNAAWRTRHFNNNSWAEVCRRHPREHHHRDWWRSHFTRFAIFGAGYYFWDSGYWYPAYGYDPGYNLYEYEEPIAAYGDLEPTQVIASVQTELQKLGYYPYEVDGQMGPVTREALANYQSDYGLEVTSAIDEPTLDSLGLL